MTGRVSGVERGRARGGVALLLSEWMGNKVVEWKEVSSRLMWVKVRMGRECWAFVSAYGPGCERSEEERDECWNELTRCVDGLSTRNYVVVLGDLNARVGDGEVEGVVGKYGVPGENESGERLLDMCVEQELVISDPRRGCYIVSPAFIFFSFFFFLFFSATILSPRYLWNHHSLEIVFSRRNG